MWWNITPANGVQSTNILLQMWTKVILSHLWKHWGFYSVDLTEDKLDVLSMSQCWKQESTK